MAFIAVYITHPSEASAKDLVDTLLEERLVACANCFPMTSAYWWQGAISRENEWVSIVKTIPENWDRLQERVGTLHSYEVPCIMKTNVEANEAYEEWIRKEVS